MDEIKMSISKLNISEKLIEGYVKIPPSLKEQVITTLAIHLCQNVKLKKDIIFEEELLQHACNPWSKWEVSVKAGSTFMCQKLPLPSALKKLLVARMRTIALQLHDWSRQQDKFELSPLFADSFLKPSDWTVVEMRLDEQKIAKRLVQDRRIPIDQRYRMACFHCLEHFILSLWNQISIKRREEFFAYDKSKIVHMWSVENFKKVKKSIPTSPESSIWRHLLQVGVFEGSISSVLQSWDKLNTSVRQDILIHIAMDAVTKVRESHYSRKGSITHILCFLLTHMSKEQRISFFQKGFQDNIHCVLACFLQWPYMDLLLPIIKELWAILPASEYRFLLVVLALRYCVTYSYNLERNDYMDYDYGYLIIQLLKETPDQFKRYVFGNSNDRSSIVKGIILDAILRNAIHKIQYREIFKHIWQHITLEERRSFLISYEGEKLCRDLANQDNCELLTSIFRECLPEDEISIFKKTFLDMNH